MRIKQSYINIELVHRIDVGEDGEVTVYTKDEKKILCKSWQVVDLGGRPFLLLEEPRVPVWIDNVEEIFTPRRSKD